LEISPSCGTAADKSADFELMSLTEKGQEIASPEERELGAPIPAASHGVKEIRGEMRDMRMLFSRASFAFVGIRRSRLTGQGSGDWVLVAMSDVCSPAKVMEADCR